MTSELQTPPTEQEISEMVGAEASAGKTNVIRRLAFQRDQLRAEVERLRNMAAEVRIGGTAGRYSTGRIYGDPDWVNRIPSCEATCDAETRRMMEGQAMRRDVQSKAEDAMRVLEQEEFAEYWEIRWEGGDWCVWDRYGQKAGEAVCIGKSSSPAVAIIQAAMHCRKRGES